MQQIHAQQSQQQAAFRALSDPTRRSILVKLSEEDMTIGEIVEQYSVTRTAIKKHLVILQEGGLISVQQNGRERLNSLEPLGLKSVDDWLNHFHQFWEETLSKLKEVVEEEQEKSERKQK